MPIDSRIALGYQAPQIESPVNMMMTAQKMQAGQQENALRQAQMENYQAEAARRNALLPYDIAKARGEADTAALTRRKTAGEIAAKKTETYMGLLPSFTSSPDALSQWLTMQHEDPDMAGTPVHDQPLDVLLAKIPRDPQGFATHVQQTALGMSNWLKENKPTLHSQDVGGSVRILSTPGLGGPATVVPDSEVKKTPTPGQELTDKRLREKGVNAATPLLSQAILDKRVPISRVNSRTAQLFEAALQIDPEADLSAINIDQLGAAAGARTAGTTKANIGIASDEANRMIGVLRDIIPTVNLTDYPSINAVQNAVSKGTGGVEVVKLNTAINSLINSYARAINPRGQPTVSDKNHAREVINNAMSKGQLAGTLEVMQQEMQAALGAASAAPGARGKAGGETPAAGTPDGMPSADAIAAEKARREAARKK